MSKIKKIKETAHTVAVMKIIDPKNNLEIDCWGYKDLVLFEICGNIVEINRSQIKKLSEFLLKETE